MNELKYTKEEIMKSLNMIKEICYDSEDCQSCPFGRCDGVCNVQLKSPQTWHIKKEEKVWKAFEQGD